jgi:hypothetical protein
VNYRHLKGIVMSQSSHTQSQKSKSVGKTKADLAAHGIKVDKKKSNMKLYLGGVGALLFAGVMVWGLQPNRASANYGLCKTYIELSVPYPHTLRFMDLKERRGTIRMIYSYIDPYGQTIFFPITCNFERDENGRKRLASVKVNRDKAHPLESAEMLSEFNKLFGIGLFKVYPPDTTRPPRLPKKITNYRK